MSDPSSNSEVPITTKEKQAKQLDMQDSPAEDLFRFIRRQPTKHLVSLLLGCFALLSFVAGTSWTIASSKAEHKEAVRVGELNSEIAGLKAEIVAANKIEGYLREDLKSKVVELQNVQQIAQELQREVSNKDRKLVAAQGCASILDEFRQIISRAKVLTKGILSAEGLAKEEMSAELRVLEGTATVLKGSMDACAGR